MSATRPVRSRWVIACHPEHAVVGRVGGGAASGFVGHVEQVAIAAQAIAVAATISHIPTGRIDDGAWTLAEPSIASLDGTPWRRAERGGAVVDVDNPSREHITDRWRERTADWRERLDAWSTADDPLASAIDAAGVAANATARVRCGPSIPSFGARPTRSALGWDLHVWRKALASWAPEELSRRRTPNRARHKIGIDVHRSIGASATVLAIALARRRRTARADVAQQHGWDVLGPTAHALDDVSTESLKRLGNLRPPNAEVALRRVGLEPTHRPTRRPSGQDLGAHRSGESVERTATRGGRRRRIPADESPTIG